MKTTIQKIREIILNDKKTTAKILRERIGVSESLIHRHLKQLCLNNEIKKIGTPPRVYYLPVIKEDKTIENKINSQIIENNFLQILPDGRFVYGLAGFYHWCDSRGFDFQDKKEEYERIYLEKELLKANELVNATEKISRTFSESFLEKIWYIDFYSWEIFGKTKIGQLVLYAKQNSDIKLMQKIAEIVSGPIQKLVQKERFKMIAVVPHSVPRKKDFLMTTLNFINIEPAPQKLFDKIFQDHAVAQKTLKSKEERQQNAAETLFLRDIEIPAKILLIDDACGSGATLNIAAQKIRERFPKTKVYGITFVGSLKGFEIIRET